MEKRFVFRFSFFDLKNENEKTNRFSFILLNFLHVKCNCGIVHAPKCILLGNRKSAPEIKAKGAGKVDYVKTVKSNTDKYADRRRERIQATSKWVKLVDTTTISSDVSDDVVTTPSYVISTTPGVKTLSETDITVKNTGILQPDKRLNANPFNDDLLQTKTKNDNLDHYNKSIRLIVIVVIVTVSMVVLLTLAMAALAAYFLSKRMANRINIDAVSRDSVNSLSYTKAEEE